MVKVSIIMPVFNAEKYIQKSIESLLKQTLQDIEIIIVNDGSTDNSKEIIKKYEEKYKDKIKYLEKENGGAADARNHAISNATGEYIAFLDSDDYAEPEMYEKMYNKAKEENSSMVECDFYWEYPHKKRLDTGIIYANKKDMLLYARVIPWNKLIKKSLIDANKISFPKGLRYEDVEFTYKLVPYCEKVSFIKEPLVHYVQRKSSVSYEFNEKTRDIFTVLDNVIDYYKKNQIYEEYKTQLEYVYTRYLLCSSLMRMVKIKDKKIREKVLYETWKNLNEKFPNWKQNEILLKSKSKKDSYMRTVNKFTYKIYCKIFRLKK